ncbi:MAG TPA: BTAD domain-containing putative transcriptional regulator [Ktedonobacteraceae bacterium]|nr:BTAD domain-containing putative transcriptional regulator [Ktedonobacteraceae bacterium]
MAVVSELDRPEQDVTGATVAPAIRYKAYLFGPFGVMRDDQLLGEPIWRRNKAKTLLKWFLLNPGKFFSVEQLSKLCWPGVEQAAAVKNLHVTIHYLRHLLEPELKAGQKSTFIRRNRHNFYWFELDESWWIDIFEIEQLSTAAKEAELCGEFLTAIAHYHELSEYYARGFLPEEVYEDAFSPYRRQYDCAHGQTLARLMQLCAQVNMFDDVLTYGLQALALDPYCEFAVKAIINVYLERGNAAGAIRMLDTFQDFLKQELGIEPGEDMLLLREKFLREYSA